MASMEATALSGKGGVCLIEVTSVSWMTTLPWKSYSQKKSHGTGFVVDNFKIMTCSHVVEDAIDLRVRRHGSARKFRAKVTTYAPDVDLALLEIIDEHREEFFGSSQPVPAISFATDIPSLQSKVTVCGYPTGGSTICLTEGVVSRVDDRYFGSAQGTLLVLQIDAAINGGNSGGPCYGSDGKCVGVAFAKSSKKNSDNIGYIISAKVVLAFLGRIAQDGTYTVIPVVPYSWRQLENRSLRLASNVPDSVHGVLLTSVSPTVEKFLQKDDVLMKIDGRPLADDGQVSLRGDEHIQHRFLLRCKHLGESTFFTVYRDGNVIETGPCILGDIPTIYLRWRGVDHLRDYLILGALVLLPLSKRLMDFKPCSTELHHNYRSLGAEWPDKWDGREGIVVLTEILAHEISFGYTTSQYRTVEKYNGVPIKSLCHLRELWMQTRKEACAAKEASPDGVVPESSFVRVEVAGMDDIVFEVSLATDAEEEILNTHQIPIPCVINEPNKRYKLGP